VIHNSRHYPENFNAIAKTTFRFGFLKKEDEGACRYLPGQFAELSIFGKRDPVIKNPPAAGWLHYGDHKLAPLRRSSSGPITAIINWRSNARVPQFWVAASAMYHSRAR
jgi:hypothetical protein